MFRVFQNIALKKISGHKRDEGTVEWIRLQNEGFLYFLLLIKYYSSDQFKKDEMGGVCGTYGERRGTYRVLLGKPEG